VVNVVREAVQRICLSSVKTGPFSTYLSCKRWGIGVLVWSDGNEATRKGEWVPIDGIDWADDSVVSVVCFLFFGKTEFHAGGENTV
jgi:hypothetical protein